VCKPLPQNWIRDSSLKHDGILDRYLTTNSSDLASSIAVFNFTPELSPVLHQLTSLCCIKMIWVSLSTKLRTAMEDARGDVSISSASPRLQPSGKKII
jgi:hypothetical protein